MKQYEVDRKLRLKLIMTQHKKHPKWKKRAWLRWFWKIFMIVGSILVGVMFYKGEEGRSISDFFVGFISGLLIFWIPSMSYYFILRKTCRSFIDYKENETLILTDKEIRNVYLPQDAKRICMYEEDIFQYTKIQRLVYNEYHQNLDIYGIYKKIWYKNYNTGEIALERGIRDKNNKLRLFLYYDDNHGLMDTISQKSGVKIEVVNYPSE